MNIHTDDKNAVICQCSGTTEKQLRQLVDSGIKSLEPISRITGACSGCGGCEKAILDLLAEYIK